MAQSCKEMALPGLEASCALQCVTCPQGGPREGTRTRLVIIHPLSQPG